MRPEEAVRRVMKLPAARRAPALRSMLQDQPRLLSRALDLLPTDAGDAAAWNARLLEAKPAASLPHVGPYTLRSVLGEGGFGVVWLATQNEPVQRSVALKILRPDRVGTPGAARFEAERQMLATLNHPNLIKVFDAGETADGRPWFTMELAQGAPITEAANAARLGLRDRVDLMTQVARAVHHAHVHGLVHLDLKPANVMFRPDGRAVLVDFGLSHHMRQPDLMAEEFRTPMGNWPYMAPEQVVGVRQDLRSDVYALGAVLYELATGELPFGVPETSTGLRRRLSVQPDPLRALRPDIPAWLQEVVLHCLETDAAQRPASAAQVAFELTHHDQIVVGERGQRLRGEGLWRQLRRQWGAKQYRPAPIPDAQAVLSAPIVVVAVPTAHTNDALFEALRLAVQRVQAGQPASRVACVTVVPPTPAGGPAGEEDSAASQHIRHLVQLHQWARPLGLGEGAVTFHVLESSRPAAALVDYACANHVDQIVLGAPTRGGRRAGGVAAQVAAEAPCSVLLVRLPASQQSPVP